MNDRTYLTPTEVCTLVAHEAVVLLDAVETAVPSCVSEFRTALETLNAVHHLGSNGQALLSWLDAEITEMCGLDDLLLGTLKPNAAKLAEGLNAELADVHAELQASAGLSAGPARQGAAEEPAPPAAPAM